MIPLFWEADDIYIYIYIYICCLVKKRRQVGNILCRSSYLPKMTYILLKMTSHRGRYLGISVSTFLMFCWIFVFFWFGANTKIVKSRYWLIDITFKVEEMPFTKHFRTYYYKQLDDVNHNSTWMTSYQWAKLRRSVLVFWNFAGFLCFSHFYGKSQNIERPLLAEIHDI